MLDSAAETCQHLVAVDLMTKDLWQNGRAIFNDLCVHLYYSVVSEQGHQGIEPREHA